MVMNGILSLNDGAINNNKALENGGGVYIYDIMDYGSTFTMTGGEINHNEAANTGGGVFVGNGTFTMTDGEINNNKALGHDGGGVSNYGTVTIAGGTMTGNSALYGGAIQNNGGALNLPAAAGKQITITGNTATIAEGGVANWGEMHLSGKVIIKDNICENKYAGTVNYPKDLATSTPITIDGDLTGSEIFITHIDGDDEHDLGTLTEDYAAKNPGAGLNTFFTYDGPGSYTMIRNADGELEVVVNAYDITNGAPSTSASTNHGYLTINKTEAVAGDPVTITVTPNSGYQFKANSLKVAKTGEPATTVTATKQQDGTYQFTMPAYAVSVSAEFEQVSSSSSGGSVISSYSITAQSAKNGTLSVDKKSASAGKTVTITVKPDKGFTLETLTVLGKNGKEVEVKSLGNNKYSFKMPSGKVTVSATFMEDNTMLNFCVDVKASDYYYDAVLWAYKNEICKGTDDVHFSPDMGTTRAQVVTFLWRAAGCPEAEHTAAAFKDVSPDAYYIKAVEWALSKGITKGTDATHFDPDAVCNRGQIVTFLARFAGVEDADTESVFDDVAATDYFAAAVKWAKDNGVTSGTSATTFSPNANCTRAQVVTFLYRWMVK